MTQAPKGEKSLVPWGPSGSPGPLRGAGGAAGPPGDERFFTFGPGLLGCIYIYYTLYIYTYIQRKRKENQRKRMKIKGKLKKIKEKLKKIKEKLKEPKENLKKL